ncbi:hypothetical protein ACFVWY_03620 [Streptomyces sp. NPDC058195]|uniref:hypothetical protein n=1 Tax=Streptomyces sp. NPDC058195 TaxID=3346375 RepID=UPI0036E7230F
MARWKALSGELDPQIREFAVRLRRLVDRGRPGTGEAADRAGRGDEGEGGDTGADADGHRAEGGSERPAVPLVAAGVTGVLLVLLATVLLLAPGR